MFQNIAELINIDIEEEIAGNTINKKLDPASSRKHLQIGFRLILCFGTNDREREQRASNELATNDFGWEFLKTVATKTVRESISVELLEDFVLGRNIGSEVKNHQEIPELIRWIVERGQSKEFTMAVKQHVSELVHSQPKYDISKIIELIDRIQANPEMIHTNAASLKTICETIVVHLAHTPVERESHEIKIMKNEIGKICDFFRGVLIGAPEHCSDIVTACLNELYKQITSNEETSNYASAVLVLVEKHMIKPDVQWILQQAENSSAIKKIFKTLSKWLETDHYTPDLNTWVQEILIGLQDQQKHDLLVELSLDIFASYVSKLPIPFYTPILGPVLLCILKSVRHTPVVFHLIIPKAPTLLDGLSKAKKKNPELLESFVDTLSALLIHFPGNDQCYQELEKCLQKYPRSKNFRQMLDVPPWHDTSQNVMVVYTNPRVGLVNLGNTCYMNSVLQALVMTKQFSREILLSKIDAPLFFQIQKLLALLLHSTRPELTPRALLAAARPPDFVPGYQQDSSEFLGYLLEKLHEQEKKLIKTDQYFEANVNNKHWPSQEDKHVQLQTMPSQIPNAAKQHSFSGAESLHQANEVPSNESSLPPTLIQKTFDGKLFVTYQCGECGSKSTNLDAFRSFELSFPEPSDLDTDYSVQKLLDFYCSSEKLIADNQYYCDKCKRLCDGERSIRILKSPKNLILTLKHFRYDQQRHTRAKLMNKVLHDEVISLMVVPEMEPPTIVRYSLYAAVVHAGTSMDSGHYYTYAQDEPDCWYKFNDNYVTKCSVDELHALSSPNTPYILFYQMLVSSAMDGINSDCLDLDEDMDETTAIVKTPPNIPMAFSTSATDYQLPELEELPSHLREIVHGDNQSYKEEIKNESRKTTQQRVGSSTFVLPKNHDSDNDDPPPNSCGSNSIGCINRFIY